MRKRALGDVLWIEPIIRRMAEKFENVVVHTRYNQLFENYPLPNVRFRNKLSFFEKLAIRLEKLAGTRFLAVNLDGAYEKKPGIHLLHAYQAAAGLPVQQEYPRIFLSEKEQSFRLVEGKYVVLHLESFAEKNFRKLYGINWNEVVQYLKAQGYVIVQVGLSSQKLAGVQEMKTSLRELIALIYHCDYFIGLDSGPSHIAASLKIPSMIFFGAVDPYQRHFPNLFRGILMKQSCEFDGKQVDINEKTLVCTRLDVSGNPVCCTYTTRSVIEKIQELIKEHVAEAHT